LLTQKGAIEPSEGGKFGRLDMFVNDIANIVVEYAVDGIVSKRSYIEYSSVIKYTGIRARDSVTSVSSLYRDNRNFLYV